jgi:hypothetical protein
MKELKAPLKRILSVVLYVLVIGALSYVAINWGVKLGVAAGMALVLVLMWSVGHRFDPIARWFGPLKRWFQRRGKRP